MSTTIAALKEAAKKYAVIREKIREATMPLNPVEIVTPINFREEKKSWIKKAENGVFTNPEFIYNIQLLDRAIPLRPKLVDLLAEVHEIICPDNDDANRFLIDQYLTVISDGLETIDLAKAIKNGDDEKASKVVIAKYGIPSKKNIEDALNIVRNNSQKDRFDHEVKQNHPYSKANADVLTKRELEAKEIKGIFEWVMNGYEAKNWPVTITDRCTSIDVRDKTSFGYPLIVIPTKRHVSGLKLAELVGHEIECHWRSSVNAEQIGVLKCDDELVYEGLAALKDKAFNRKYREVFELNSAHYVVAINEAMNGSSFAKVSALIYSYLPVCLAERRVEKAWTYTFRVFRGITDSTNPSKYAFTKDRAYYEGYCYARNLVEQGKDTYLSFSTLGRENFAQFMKIVDIEDVKTNAVLDKNLQEKSLEKILRCLNYIGSIPPT